MTPITKHIRVTNTALQNNITLLVHIFHNILYINVTLEATKQIYGNDAGDEGEIFMKLLKITR